MELIIKLIIEFIITVLIFTVLFAIGRFIYKKIESKKSRFLDPSEYFPDEELTTLKQVFYLIMIFLFFVILLYSIVMPAHELIFFAVLEIIVMLYVAITLDYTSWKNKVLYFLLIPYGAITCLFLFGSGIILLDLIHLPVLVYLMKVYYDKFREYTETNGLGITIVLLFSLIFISFLITVFIENDNALDAIVMVSNAFTSNGYAVLGTTSVGKFNSLILVWGGYILSGVGTATLTAAILMRQFNKRFNELKSLIDESKCEDEEE